MIKQTLTVVALVAALAAPVFAQTTKPMNAAPDPQSPLPKMSTTQRLGTFVQEQKATEWRSSKLVGADVYGPGDDKIGAINDVLIASTGNVQAVVVGVGGFLGVGEKNVAIPFDALTITRKPNGATISKVSVTYSKDDLKNAPKFAWYQSSESQTTGSGAGSTYNSNGSMKK
jgi:sporulation protein YlmC with PRC-barrel domain